MTISAETLRFRVGYGFDPTKVDTFITPSIVDLASQNGVDLVAIEPTKPLVEQGPFDCVLHKLYGPEWSQQLAEFASEYPNAVIIDPPELVEPLHNRVTMLDSVARIHLSRPETTVGVPKQKVVEGEESVEEAGLKYPVVVKPLLANGGTTSHDMWVVLNSEGFESVKDGAPLLVQEYVNHGEVVFKVYVMGDHVQCVKRRSLADIHPTEEDGGMWSGVSAMLFSKISSCATVEHESEKLDEAVMPPPELVAELGRRLRKALGLRLFNFDVIRESEEKYAVIDINYYPGFSKLPHFEQIFANFILDMCKCN